MTNGFNRREFVGAAAAAGTALAFGAPAIGADRSQRPNVIFIMADDMGYADLSCTGSHHIKTPAIDSIAQNGLLLRQGYSNSSICSPTRTALLTGCYQYRFRVGLEEPMTSLDYGVPLDRPTIASAFRALGYRTKLVGKWHLGAPPEHGPLQHGYDEFLGLLEGAGDYFRHAIVADGKNFGSGLVQGNDPIERAGYLTDLFGDEAVRTIETVRKGQPLFMSLHFNAPHWPWEGPEDRAVSDTLGDIFHRDGGNLATYKKMVEAMDANVAKLLAALNRMGMRENTIVVFTSDNGGERFSETWPFVGVKGELLEGGIRVPILMQWPGKIAAGSRSEQVMMSMDFLPSLLAMADKAPGAARDFDGMDLSAQLKGGNAVERTLFWRFNANDQAAVRSGDWKYLKLAGREYLFNLSQDERERANLLGKHPDRAADMRRAFDEWNAAMLPYPLASYSEDVSTSYVDRY